METIQDILDWLQEAENNGMYTCGTQNVKRHLESVQKHQALRQDAVIESVCERCGEEKEINGVSGYCDDCRSKNR